MKLDRNQPFSKIVIGDGENRSTHFQQNGIDFDVKGDPLDEKQVKAHYASQAAEAQQKADDARKAAEAAQAAADKTREDLGVTKTAVKKAQSGG